LEEYLFFGIKNGEKNGIPIEEICLGFGLKFYRKNTRESNQTKLMATKIAKISINNLFSGFIAMIISQDILGSRLYYNLWDKFLSR